MFTALCQLNNMPSAQRRARRRADLTKAWVSLHHVRPMTSVRQAHARVLLRVLLSRLHAQSAHDSGSLIAAMLRGHTHLPAAVGQAGLHVLCTESGPPRPAGMRFLWRIAWPDAAHRRAILTELAHTYARAGERAAACELLRTELKMCAAAAGQPCEHDADVHGHLGVALHSVLQPPDHTRPPLLAAAEASAAGDGTTNRLRSEAGNHLRRALERRPDASRFAGCLAILP